MHKLKARLHPTFALVCALLGSACVDEFDGANIQMDFGAATPRQFLSGAGVMGAHLPSNTHYRLYGVNETYDGTGALVATDYVELQRFEIHRIIELASPCYIDPEGTRFPGVHVTQFAAKMSEATGITDITAPPPGTAEEDIIDQSTALQRMRNIARLGSEVVPPADPGGLKAVTSASVVAYPAVGTQCVRNNPGVDMSLIPPSTCADDESNALRLQLCKKFWADNPDYYEGTDRVLTEPLAGNYYGIVLGRNPVNDAVLGGVQFFVENPVIHFDFYEVRFQFDDINGDGTPDTPPTMPLPAQGAPFLRGAPNSQTRGVIRATLLSLSMPTTTNLAAQISIFSQLDKDDVHF
jgi:hypothetical protein